MRNMSSPRLLRKLSMNNRQKPLRIAVLGQNGVGKSEKVYTCTRYLDGDNVTLEVLDTAAQEEKSRIEEHIKWADAFILMYSVTDSCSFSEVCRLKFLINAYGKRQRKHSASIPETNSTTTPVALVGNQIDRPRDRMVSEEDGRRKSIDLGCVGFYEISVRESIESVCKIFEDIYVMCRKPRKCRQICKQLSLPAFIAEDRTDEDGNETSSLSRRRKAVFTLS
ncbi:hypothetical protein FSP39_023290 [Pinctada imbricata]|uniref:small monomeric GTPase n=1 Tax=Pinctada imbricata TaxID=66713 RepID=A0AA89C814_PINIB|nr:hypothetical protein FSP39_023290 [Pinctada imbricata]